VKRGDVAGTRTDRPTRTQTFDARDTFDRVFGCRFDGDCCRAGGRSDSIFIRTHVTVASTKTLAPSNVCLHARRRRYETIRPKRASYNTELMIRTKTRVPTQRPLHPAPDNIIMSLTRHVCPTSVLCTSFCFYTRNVVRRTANAAYRRKRGVDRVIPVHRVAHPLC